MYSKKLLDKATKDIIFWFNGKLLKQTEGIATESLLGPTIVIYLCVIMKASGLNIALKSLNPFAITDMLMITLIEI